MYVSYRKTCERLGLLAGDLEGKQPLMEVLWSSFQPITELFVIITAQCHAADPKKLVERHKGVFILDHRTNIEKGHIFK